MASFSPVTCEAPSSFCFLSSVWRSIIQVAPDWCQTVPCLPSSGAGHCNLGSRHLKPQSGRGKSHVLSEVRQAQQTRPAGLLPACALLDSFASKLPICPVVVLQAFLKFFIVQVLLICSSSLLCTEGQATVWHNCRDDRTVGVT